MYRHMHTYKVLTYLHFWNTSAHGYTVCKASKNKVYLNYNSILDFFSYLVQIRFLLRTSHNDKDSK